jgi:hypothetical protein
MSDDNKSKMKLSLKLSISLEIIKSKTILNKIFKNLQTKKILKIIKNNKYIQKKLDISLDDFNDYCKIEIEIKTIPNKYGKFIQISNSEMKSYYHFYFDNNKEEIKRN